MVMVAKMLVDIKAEALAVEAVKRGFWKMDVANRFVEEIACTVDYWVAQRRVERFTKAMSRIKE